MPKSHSPIDTDSPRVFDVFLSHSSKDKNVVRELAERLKQDGLNVWFDEWILKPGDNIPAKIDDGLEHSRVLLFFMSANAFGSDWATLESHTFRFRDPLNKSRRFIPLRLDTAPIKGSLAQFLYIDWLPTSRRAEYPKLLAACRVDEPERTVSMDDEPEYFRSRIVSLGHAEAISSISISSDGRRAVSGSFDNLVRVWNVDSGRCERVLEGHTDEVNSVALSRNGRRVVSGAADKTVRIWELESGQCERVLEGHTGNVYGVALSNDNRRAVSGAFDGAVRIWQVESGQCERILKGHTGNVYSVALSSDGRRVVSGAADKTLRIWDVKTGRCERVLEGHTDFVLSIALSRDGRRVVSGSFDETVRIWDVESGQCERVLKGHTGRVYSVDLSGDGRRAVSGAADHKVRLWDVKSGQCERVLQGHTGSVYSVALSSDGRRAVTGTEDNVGRVWDVESGRCEQMLQGHTGYVYNTAWSSNGRRAVSGASEETVRIWEMESGNCERLLEGHTGNVYCVVLSGDGQRALSGSFDQTVRVWEVESGRCERVLEGHTGIIYGVAVSSDGRRALSGANDQTVRVWEVESGRCERVLEGHFGIVYSVALSSDGRRAVSGATDKTVRVWDVESGRCERVLEGHTDEVNSVALSSDGRLAVSGADDKTVRIWEIDSGRCERVFEGHTGIVYSVALSSDGRRVVSGADDNTVRVWDLEGGRCLGVLVGHTAHVTSVAWSYDNTRILSSAVNGIMHIWNVGSGRDERKPVDRRDNSNVQYTNAKVLLVGDSGVGKSGLSTYLAHGIKVEDDKPLPSTDGAWATQWALRQSETQTDIEREIWLWDFAGQVDYRLVHQLYMEDTAAAVLVFNPQNENPFEGLGHWESDLRKAARKPFAKLLAAGRIDRGGLVVGEAGIAKFMAERGFAPPLHLTSAKTGEGCDQLRDAIQQAINWTTLPTTTSPILYQRLKQEILKLRDSGLVLIRLAELMQRLELVLYHESFDLAQLEAVLKLLSGPGMILRLDFGGFVLLRPEVLSRYAAAVVRKVRKHPQELGCIREDDVLDGVLDYQDFKRLPADDEVVVLRALLDTFVSRAWCLRQIVDGDTVLTFPSYFRRERKEQPSHPSVLVTYRFSGPVHEIYATLVVLLHHTVAFESDELWKSAADFKTQTGASLGFSLKTETEGSYRLDVYFDPNVDENSRVLFLRYIHDHLNQQADNVVRLRNYFCANKKCKRFNTVYADREAIDEAIRPDGDGKVFCPGCGKGINLHDAIETKFDSDEVKEEVREMKTQGQSEIDSESRRLILAGHAYAIATEAGQVYRGYTKRENGIDGEIRFRNDDGSDSGKTLYLQFSPVDSSSRLRLRDEPEGFQFFVESRIEYWQYHDFDVMLIFRMSSGEIRWLNLNVLRDIDSSGFAKIDHSSFQGERFDAMSVRRWRDRLFSK
jgi:WD40 repeat protein